MPASVNAPSDVRFYKPSRNKYAIAWRINPIFTDTGIGITRDAIDSFDCEVQIDTNMNFDTVSMKSYNIHSALDYQNGYFYKSFVLPYPSTLLNYNMYARVRVNGNTYLSSWSEIITLTFNKVNWYEDTNLLIKALPGDNIYIKEGVDNAFKIIEAYCREIQELKRETGNVGKANNYYKTQDSDMYDMLGSLLESVRNTNRPFIEYRGEVLDLWESYLKAGTEAGVKKFVKSIMGVEPDIRLFRDRYGWIIWDEQQYPFTGSSTPYLDNEMHYLLHDPLYSSLDGYTPQPYSSYGKGAYWILDVYNPWHLRTRRTFIEKVVNMIKPANTRVYFRYYAPDESTAGWGDSEYWGGVSFWGQAGRWAVYTPTD